MMRSRTTKIAISLLAAGLALGGCSDSTGPNEQGGAAPAGSAAPGAFNDADVTFATQMIGHHSQAVEMAEIALDRADAPEVKKLAEDIRAAQQPEIEQMSGWLEDWDKPVPSTGGGHGGMNMPGMMGAEDMAMLETATGADFDRTWLEMMIRHHEGAVEMAEEEQEQGADPAAKELAGRIIEAQTAEIATMRTLLEP